MDRLFILWNQCTDSVESVFAGIIVTVPYILSGTRECYGMIHTGTGTRYRMVQYQYDTSSSTYFHTLASHQYHPQTAHITAHITAHTVDHKKANTPKHTTRKLEVVHYDIATTTKCWNTSRQLYLLTRMITIVSTTYESNHAMGSGSVFIEEFVPKKCIRGRKMLEGERTTEVIEQDTIL